MPRSWHIRADASPRDKEHATDPPGYSASAATHAARAANAVANKPTDLAKLKVKKANELAFQPAKSFAMTAFMMYMSGNSVNIFPIMITMMAVYNPIRSILAANAAFAPYNDDLLDNVGRAQLFSAKAMYVALNMVAMSGALYKMSLMGLLPNTPSDWVGYLRVPLAAQVSSGGPAFV